MNMPPFQVRPGWTGRGSGRFTRFLVEFVIATTLFLVLAPLGLAVSGMDNSWIVDIPVVLTVAIAGSAGLLYLKNQRAGVIDGELYRVSAFGRRRRWPISAFHEVVRVQITVGEGWYSEWPVISPAVFDADLLVNERGLVVTSFTGMWPRNGLSRLWGAMGLRVSQPWHGPVRMKELRRRYVGAVPILPSSW
jgi:hypothetical protein